MTGERHTDFADLHFADAEIDEIELVGGGVLAIEFRNVAVVTEAVVLGKPHPELIAACRIEFAGVSKSRRIIREYDPAQQHGFKPPVVVQDVAQRTPVGRSTATFELEGRLRSPPSWVEEWVIEATHWTISGCRRRGLIV